MRLDKYLKVSRLIKRRTVANEACDAGRVLVNDKPAKASVQVKAGDTVEIQFGSKTQKIFSVICKEYDLHERLLFVTKCAYILSKETLNG